VGIHNTVQVKQTEIWKYFNLEPPTRIEDNTIVVELTSNEDEMPFAALLSGAFGVYPTTVDGTVF
jgi:hypothetical protein